jgi:sulfonate transport system substrate-binding protein
MSPRQGSINRILWAVVASWSRTEMARHPAIVIWGILFTLFSGLLTGTARAAEKQTTEAVHMGSFSKAVDYAPYLVARNKHWFEDALKQWQVPVTYDTFQTLPSINEAFASKKIDVVFEAEAPAIVGKAAGIDLDIKGVSAVLNLQFLVHKNSGITKIGDLKGKKVAVLAGTSAHYGLLKNLEKAGLSKKDVSILDMTPPDARSAFESNKIDAWAIWPPFVQQSIIAGSGTVIPNATAQIVVVMVVRKGFELEHPNWMAAILKTLNQSKAWVIKNPAEAQRITSAELNVPLNVIQMAWPSHHFDAQLNPAVVADIQEKADFLKNVGFVRKSIDVKNTLVSPQ